MSPPPHFPTGSISGVWTVYREVGDSLDGIVAANELSNYLPAPVVQALDQHFLKPLPSGGTAEHTELTVTGWAIGD